MKPGPALGRFGGFTLVEAIMMIVITGIIAGMVAVFIRSPVDAYLAAERRAAMTDEADLAARRMARDFRAALPNSIRMPSRLHADPSGLCVVFLPSTCVERYRYVV